MRANLWAAMLAIVLIAGPSTGWSQRGVINPATNYDDLSKRETRSSERDEKKKADAKKAEDAKRKAEEEKKRDERRKEYEERRKKDDKDDKDDKKPADAANAAKAGAAGKATSATGSAADAMKAAMAARAKKGDGKAAGKEAAGGTTDPTSREVTEVMLDSVRTQSVNFNVEAAENDPGVILLNAPKFNSSSRTRAGDAGMAQPL